MCSATDNFNALSLAYLDRVKLPRFRSVSWRHCVEYTSVFLCFFLFVFLCVFFSLLILRGLIQIKKERKTVNEYITNTSRYFMLVVTSLTRHGL